jgi:hypothetical protein
MNETERKINETERNITNMKNKTTTNAWVTSVR